jgi:hypothetical protein
MIDDLSGISLDGPDAIKLNAFINAKSGEKKIYNLGPQSVKNFQLGVLSQKVF